MKNVNVGRNVEGASSALAKDIKPLGEEKRYRTERITGNGGLWGWRTETLPGCPPRRGVTQGDVNDAQL